MTHKWSYKKQSLMWIFGLIGGVASGKSLVAAELARLGAVVLDADQAAHDVLRRDDVKQEVRATWGDGVFGTDGQVDRARLAAVAFADRATSAQERKKLEAITHPRIGQLMQSRFAEIAARQPPAIVLDVPLLLEAGWEGLCDRVILVDAADEVRRQRAATRGWSAEELARREQAQRSLAEKRARADVIIDNSGSVEATRGQIEQFWKSLGEKPA